MNVPMNDRGAEVAEFCIGFRAELINRLKVSPLDRLTLGEDVLGHRPTDYEQGHIDSVVERMIKAGYLAVGDHSEIDLVSLIHCDHGNVDECRLYGCVVQYPWPLPPIDDSVWDHL